MRLECGVQRRASPEIDSEIRTEDKPLKWKEMPGSTRAEVGRSGREGKEPREVCP